jgi:hypothetical protein
VEKVGDPGAARDHDSLHGVWAGSHGMEAVFPQISAQSADSSPSRAVRATSGHGFAPHLQVG